VKRARLKHSGALTIHSTKQPACATPARHFRPPLLCKPAGAHQSDLYYHRHHQHCHYQYLRQRKPPLRQRCRIFLLQQLRLHLFSRLAGAALLSLRSATGAPFRRRAGWHSTSSQRDAATAVTKQRGIVRQPISRSHQRRLRQCPPLCPYLLRAYAALLISRSGAGADSGQKHQQTSHVMLAKSRRVSHPLTTFHCSRCSPARISWPRYQSPIQQALLTMWSPEAAHTATKKPRGTACISTANRHHHPRHIQCRHRRCIRPCCLHSALSTSSLARQHLAAAL